MSNFRPIDRETRYLLPPSVDEWLPQRHLARFVVEVVDGFDLRVMEGSYRGSGSASYHPRVERLAARRLQGVRHRLDRCRLDGRRRLRREALGQRLVVRPAQAHGRAGVRHHQGAIGFRRFSLRGLDAVRGEWSLVTMAWNIKRLHTLRPAWSRDAIVRRRSRRQKLLDVSPKSS